MNNIESLKYFHPLIRKWFISKVGTPTDVQEKVWPLISQNKNLLITAPTGSGKTLASFLWSINQLITGKWEQGKTRVLYISPLKALNNDIQKNLIKPLEEIKNFFLESGEKFFDIKVMARSMDTTDIERSRMVKRPPEILITTPESLNILLTSANNSSAFFFDLKTVIVDEIHAVIGTKRGTHLISAIERLTLYSPEFQRIGISATIKPLDKVNSFFSGFIKTINNDYIKREVITVKSADRKVFDVKVCSAGNNESVDEETYWQLVITEIKKIIKENKSTLIFTNSRRHCEKTSRLINENEDKIIAYSHHGSLSYELRLEVEQKLKNGSLKAIAATNSLELGIDVGALDKVVLIQSPFSISSAIQKIGRSGHSVNEISSGLVFPLHGKDFLKGAVIANAVMENDIEECKIIDSPLDVLSQIILSMAVTKEWNIDEMYHFIKTIYPYRDLPRNHFDLIIDMLAGRYEDIKIRELYPKITVDKVDNTVKAKSNAAYIIYLSGGTIIDRGYYDLRHSATHAKIGEVDEEFVWERKIGETFAFGNQVWKILKITHNDVEVIPTAEDLNIIPFWKAESYSRDFYFSLKILNFLKNANDNLDKTEFKKELIENYRMSHDSAFYLIDYLKLQKEVSGTILPDRNNILIENYSDPMNRKDSRKVIIHTFWGTNINRPLAIILSAIWEEKYKYQLQFFIDNDAILLEFPNEADIKKLFSMINRSNVNKYLRKSLEKSTFFSTVFRESAQRSMLLPKTSFNKRMPLWFNRLRSKKMLDAVMNYEDFPILIETWRSCINDEFDVPDLLMLIEEVNDNKIKINEINLNNPSPFASSLIWRETNLYMYQDDAPLANKISNLKNDYIKDLLFSSKLRPKIDSDIISDFDKKLKWAKDGYSPDNKDDLFNFIIDRILIPIEEWNDLVLLIKKDHGIEINDLISDYKTKIVKIKFPQAENYLVGAVENLKKIISAFELDIKSIDFNALFDEEDLKKEIDKNINKILKDGKSHENYSLPNLLGQWLSFYGPIESGFIEKNLGTTKEMLDDALSVLVENEVIIVDEITGSNLIEVCDAKNLEILLRIQRKKRVAPFKPLSIDYMSLFLSYFQNIISNENDTIDCIEKLKNLIETLFGYPISPESLEESIITARIKNYYTNHLDNLILSTNLKWFGYSKNKIFLSFIEDLALFKVEKKSDEEILNKLFKDINAKYDFFDILENSGLNSQELSELLWKLVWQGAVSNDMFDALRKGILNKFKFENKKDINPVSRLGFSRWKSSRPLTGSWFAVKNRSIELDKIEEEEVNKERIRVLLKRYGILFKELLVNEMPALQWKNIFYTLRLMEFSQEVMTGFFFEGIKGLQFISTEAYEFLKVKMDEDKIYWINACDPASLCGIKVENINELLPQRNISNFIVYHGIKIVMVIKNNFRKIEIFLNYDDKKLLENYILYFRIFNDILTRNFNPLKKISVERINEKPAMDSEYLTLFKKFGFKLLYKKMELWKEYK